MISEDDEKVMNAFHDFVNKPSEYNCSANAFRIEKERTSSKKIKFDETCKCKKGHYAK